MPARGVLSRFCDIRPGEGARTALMFFNVLVLIAAYTATKAVRDAAFLAHFGLTELSTLMIVVAVVAGFLVSVFTRVTSGLPRHLLIYGTNGLIAVTLVAAAPGLRAGWPWLTWALYFWSSVFGLLLVAEFWLLANDLFHAREAKRLFPLIGAGAILGGVVGGGLSGWLARPLGSANVLYIVAVLLLVAAGLSHLAWRHRPLDARAELRRPPARPDLAAGVHLLRKNGYVRLLALMLICMTLCMTFVQWQFKGIAKVHFASRPDDMTAFFGGLAALVNGVSFFLQMFGTPRLLKRFGVNAGLRLLPLGFMVGAVALLAAVATPLAALWAAGVAMMFSDTFRFSVDKASVELLYLPIPRAVKDQAKPFIDTVVDRFAGALAGLSWLFLTWWFHVDQPGRIEYVSLVVLAVAAVWLLVIARARRGYVEAYRRMLGPARASASDEAHPRQRACQQILDGALHLDASLRTRTLRSIGRLQRSQPTLRFPREAIEPLLLKETTTIALLVRVLGVEGVAPMEDRRRSRTLLVRTVEEKLDEALERIARLLALAYAPHDILAAHRALRAGSSRERAGALELLDNLLEGSSKSELLSVLDDLALGSGRLPREARDAILAELREQDDPWLRACAAWTAHTTEVRKLACADTEPAPILVEPEVESVAC